MTDIEKFKIFVATIYGEANNASPRSWEVVAHSMRNRIAFGEWAGFSTIHDVITKTGYDAYKDRKKHKPYIFAMRQLNTGNISPKLKSYC